jgi:hypothetical protein
MAFPSSPDYSQSTPTATPQPAGIFASIAPPVSPDPSAAPLQIPNAPTDAYTRVTTPGTYDLNYQVPSVYENLPNGLAYMFDKFADQQKNASSVNEIGAKAMAGMTLDQQDAERQTQDAYKKVQDVLAQTHNLDDDQFNQYMSRLSNLAQQRNPYPALQAPQQPNALQLGLGLIGAATSPHFAADTIAAPFEAETNLRNLQYQHDVQAWNAADQQKKEDIAATESQLGASERRDALRQQLWQQNVTNNLDVLKISQSHEQFMYGKNLQRLNQLQTLYERSKGLDDMKRIAGQMGSLMGVDIPDDQVQRDFQTKTLGQKKAAFQEWESSLSHELNQFGEVSPDRQDALRKQRQTIADYYNIPVDALRDVPTGDTLKAQAQQMREDQFKQTFGEKQWKDHADYATKLANLDLATRRVNQIAQRDQTNAFMGQSRLTLAQQREAYQEQIGAMRAANASGNTEYYKLGLQLAKIKPTDPTAQAQAQTIRAQQQFILQHMPGDQQVQAVTQAMNDMFGGASPILPTMTPQQPQQPQAQGGPVVSGLIGGPTQQNGTPPPSPKPNVGGWVLPPLKR